MSILIKGMKMPESCPECPFTDYEMHCPLTDKTYNWGLTERASDCPLVETVDYFNHGVMLTMVKQTNADRIRQMTDEELASKFADIYCPDGLSVNHERCKHNYLKGQPIEVCEECWLEWLKQECEE